MPISAYQEQLRGLYNRYSDEFKPWLAAVEAKYEEFPAAVLNEIRAFVDHISRCYINSAEDQIIERNIDRAASHLDRAIYDCLKFLIVWYFEDIKEFERQTKNIDLSLITDGRFYVAFRGLKSEAENRVRRAKELEKRDHDASYRLFQEALDSYMRLSGLITDNLSNVDWARRKRNKSRTWKIIGWFLTAIISGAISYYASTLF